MIASLSDDSGRGTAPRVIGATITDIVGVNAAAYGLGSSADVPEAGEIVDVDQNAISAPDCRVLNEAPPNASGPRDVAPPPPPAGEPDDEELGVRDKQAAIGASMGEQDFTSLVDGEVVSQVWVSTGTSEAKVIASLAREVCLTVSEEERLEPSLSIGRGSCPNTDVARDHSHAASSSWLSPQRRAVRALGAHGAPNFAEGPRASERNEMMARGQGIVDGSILAQSALPLDALGQRFLRSFIGGPLPSSEALATTVSQVPNARVTQFVAVDHDPMTREIFYGEVSVTTPTHTSIWSLVDLLSSDSHEGEA